MKYFKFALVNQFESQTGWTKLLFMYQKIKYKQKTKYK